MPVELPTPLLNGTISARCIYDIMRSRKPEYESLFHTLPTVGHWYIPPFQRPAVWTRKQNQRLIESLWLGISIGSIVVSAVSKVEADGKYAPLSDCLIDGQQRLRAIAQYLADDLVVFEGTPHAHAYSDLSERQRRKFDNTPVGFIQLPPATEAQLRDLYDRLNFGGTAHLESQRATISHS